DLWTPLALPALWTGPESSPVATTLLDVLVRMLCLDFAYLRTTDLTDESPREWIRSATGSNRYEDAQEAGRALEPYLAEEASFRIANPVAEGTLSIAVFHLGIQDRVGTFVGASQRSDFPSETERLLLQVATNQAAIALQEASRITQRVARVALERTRAEAALQESEERLRRMADSIPEVIWITALEPEEVLYTSPSFERI